MFKRARGLRLVPLFRFCFMVVRADIDPDFRRNSTTWTALRGERLISLVPSNPLQRLANQHVARGAWQLITHGVINYVDTLLALVEAGDGSGIAPSWALAACRNRRVVMSRLINPIVDLDFLSNQRSRKETSSKRGGIHVIPAELHRKVGRSRGNSVRLERDTGETADHGDPAIKYLAILHVAFRERSSSRAVDSDQLTSGCARFRKKSAEFLRVEGIPYFDGVSSAERHILPSLA